MKATSIITLDTITIREVAPIITSGVRIIALRIEVLEYSFRTLQTAQVNRVETTKLGSQV
jgi:hypothetical protein